LLTGISIMIVIDGITVWVSKVRYSIMWTMEECRKCP